MTTCNGIDALAWRGAPVAMKLFLRGLAHVNKCRLLLFEAQRANVGL
jgi:hypothetical protein